MRYVLCGNFASLLPPRGKVGGNHQLKVINFEDPVLIGGTLRLKDL